MPDWNWKRTLVAAVGAGTLGAALAAAAGAAGARTVYSSTLYGNIPNVTVRGVVAGSAPWIVKGTAKVTSTSLVVRGTDLVVPAGYLGNGKPVPKGLINTTVGIPAVAAELSCAQGTSVLTSAASLSKKGAFSIDARVKLPTACTDPIILVGPVNKGKMVAWFASTDFLVYGLPGKSTLGWKGSSKGSSGSSSSWSG